MAVSECHPFVGLRYRATTHSACHIYIANTAGHITSPTSKAASWKAQRILAEIYSPHLYASETCWSEVISHPLPFCVSCVKLANTLMTHFQNFYTCKDKPLQPSQPPVIKPNPLLLYTSWKSYNPKSTFITQFIKDLYQWRGGWGWYVNIKSLNAWATLQHLTQTAAEGFHLSATTTHDSMLPHIHPIKSHSAVLAVVTLLITTCSYCFSFLAFTWPPMTSH